jgi:hypothetical protein
MRLSVLQKYILRQCFLEKKRFNRHKLINFYSNVKKAPKKEDQVNIITKSIERLIDKGLLVGYGERTREKWFIKEIRLTPVGGRLARELLGKQQKLKI